MATSTTCLRDTDSTTMTQDIDGDVGTDVKLHAPDSGIGIVSDGLYVNNYGNGGGMGGSGVGGIGRTADGLFSRQTYTHAGWFRGINDVSNPGTAVGAGQYVQVNPVIAMNFARQGPLTQYLHFTFGAEMLMTLSDFPASNQFWGWACALEVWYDFSPGWFEVCAQGMGGPQNAFNHQLRGEDWVVLTESAVHTVQMRMTIRGGLAGTAVCSQTAKRYVHVDYH